MRPGVEASAALARTALWVHEISRLHMRARSPLITVEGELFSSVWRENNRLRRSLFASDNYRHNPPASPEPSGSNPTAEEWASSDNSFTAAWPSDCQSGREEIVVICPVRVDRASSPLLSDYVHSMSVRELTSVVFSIIQLGGLQ